MVMLLLNLNDCISLGVKVLYLSALVPLTDKESIGYYCSETAITVSPNHTRQYADMEDETTKRAAVLCLFLFYISIFFSSQQ